MMMVFAYFVLTIPGYLDVDGKHFSIREECRNYAIEKYKDYSLKDLPNSWSCRAIMEEKPLPFKDREIQY